MDSIEKRLIYAVDTDILRSYSRWYLIYRDRNSIMSNTILRTLFYVLLGVLKSVVIILKSVPSDKRVTEILAVLEPLIILIDDVVNDGALWVETNENV